MLTHTYSTLVACLCVGLFHESMKKRSSSLRSDIVEVPLFLLQAEKWRMREARLPRERICARRAEQAAVPAHECQVQAVCELSSNQFSSFPPSLSLSLLFLLFLLRCGHGAFSLS